MKTTKTIAALALTAIAGASLVGCSMIEEAASAPEPVSMKAGTYVHEYTFGDDLEHRLVVDYEGGFFMSSYNCQNDEPKAVEMQVGTVKGDQLIFEDPEDGSEIDRAQLWQAHTMDPKTREADLDRPMSLFDVGGTTFKPARNHNPCS